LQHMLDAMKTMADNTAAITEKLALIRTKASGIGVVVVTITKIADQTNLLSLNASIEAEKAGEHGLGFAVVAGEIRRLADQTAVATLDIERMVNDLHTVVTDGVKAVEQFAEVVRQGAADAESVGARQAGIIDAAKTLAPRVETVSQGMHSQAQGAEQINAAMIRLTQGARATASSLQEFAKATGQLRDAVDGLRAEIAAFSVGASDATVARCGK
ncbi:MAG: methyl-accepting chemotaxis protein, partial [Planctomycetota bacterium]|nr:methyl-accepting chemotaxis protein [Planctomycetota bacterium]